MEEYEVVMSRLTEMRSRYDSGFSSSDRLYIENLYPALLGKRVRRTGCGDCYRDAFIEIYTYLKRTGTMPTKPNYILKAGVVIHPRGTNQFYANNNIPDNIAEEHLAQFPEAIEDFKSYPIDYLARVEARKNGEAPSTDDAEALAAALQKEKAVSAEVKKALDDAHTELAAAKEELAQLKEQSASQGGDDDAISSLSMENETLKADLETANNEIAELKKTIEELKAVSTTTKKRAAKSAE